MLDSNTPRRSARITRLLETLHQRGFSDRSGEWFKQSMFQDIAKVHPREPVIVRRAYAFAEMLRAMANPENSKSTHSYEIQDGELIVGTAPMGSVGLGKVFPYYLTKEERRLSSMTSRDEKSMFGHNCPDLGRIAQNGLQSMIDFSNQRIAFLRLDSASPLSGGIDTRKKISFYQSVVICCQAVIDYAERYADLARSMAAEEKSPARQKELLEIERICRKVPRHPAESFQEALQAIWFGHLALQSTMDLTSPGRLDQVLQPFYARSLQKGEITASQATEQIQCFLLKGAGRLNMTTRYLVTQDHLDYGTGLGTSPVFLDQMASCNNFMQNIVVGGVDSNGKDASNDCTYLFLEACSHLGVPTPSLTVRVHSHTPEKLKTAIAKAIDTGSNGLPIIYNDDTIIPAFVKSGIPLAVARDYAVDGCWEPILNAAGDWTFGSVNLLVALECALNAGCRITSNNPSLLRGQKASFATPLPDDLKTFDDFLDALRVQIQFFTDKVGLGIFDFYCIDSSVTPTPFLSALLSRCLEKGVDKTWGGADYILGGIISIAHANCANAIAAIKHFVYDTRQIKLSELVERLRNNLSVLDAETGKTIDDPWKKLLLDYAKFGNNDPQADLWSTWLMDTFHTAARNAEKLASRVFLERPSPTDKEEQEHIRALRSLAGYEGPSMKERFGDNFHIHVTIGSGTFGQYVSNGKGVAASADGRNSNTAVAPNCSPTSGTALSGVGNILASMSKLKLDRFAAGVMLDLCVEPTSIESLENLLTGFMHHKGNIMSVSVASKEKLQKADQACCAAESDPGQASKLVEFQDLSVRVGGWNAPFVTFSGEQRQNYLARHQTL